MKKDTFIMRKDFLRLVLFCVLFLTAAIPALSAAVKLPSGTRIIGEEAFLGDESLEEVLLPDGIREIRSRAFVNSGLERLNLPASLTAIADDAFDFGKNIQMTAVKESYAYEWAVRNGYIEEEGHIRVRSFDLDRKLVILKAGESLQLNPVFYPENATNKNIVWSSNRPQIVQVADGKIEAQFRGGYTVISAKTEDGGFVAECTVSVVLPAPQLNSAYYDASLDEIVVNWEPAGEYCGDYKAYEVTISEIDREIVDGDVTTYRYRKPVKGVSYPVSVATRWHSDKWYQSEPSNVISVYVPDGSSHTEEKVTSITVSPASLTVHTDEIRSFSANVSPATADDPSVEWSVINGTGKGSISKRGSFIGTQAGTVTVVATARDGSGVSGRATVTIKESATVIPAQAFSISHGNELLFDIADNVTSFTAEFGAASDSGDRYTLTIEGNQNWSVQSNCDWIDIPSAQQSGSGDGTVTLKINSNVKATAMRGEVCFSVGGRNLVMQIVKPEWAAGLELSMYHKDRAGYVDHEIYCIADDTPRYNNGITLGAATGLNDRYTFYVESNFSWSISTSGNWFSVSPTSGDGSNDAAAVVMTFNSKIKTAKQTGTITITAGESNRSATIQVIKPELVLPGPGEPDGISSMYITTSDAAIYWNQVEGADSYKAYVSKSNTKPSNARNEEIILYKDNSWGLRAWTQLLNLSPNTQYFYWVSACTEDGGESCSGPYEFKTWKKPTSVSIRKGQETITSLTVQIGEQVQLTQYVKPDSEVFTMTFSGNHQTAMCLFLRMDWSPGRKRAPSPLRLRCIMILTNMYPTQSRSP